MDRKNIFDNDKLSGKKITYYVLLAVCVVVIGAASFLSYKSIQNALNKKETPQLSNTTDLVNSEKNDIVETEKNQPEVKQESQNQPEKPQQQPEEKPEPAVEAKAYKMPLDGDVTTGFSLDVPVYSTTLKDWRIHDGIDIAAELGTDVTAVNDGAVEKIENDDLFGVTVTIRHTDGKKSTYANLADTVELEEGQLINRGDIVGQVGNTAIYEVSDGPHLHFEMSDGGEKIDPTAVISK